MIKENKFDKFNEFDKSEWELVKRTFRTVPKELGLKLYEKYRKDFELFGYEKPEWLC